MKKFLKKSVNEINSVKKFIDAGRDIPALKRERDQLNNKYAEIIEQHNKWKKFSAEITNFNTMLDIQNQLKLGLTERIKSDPENQEIYAALIVEADKCIMSVENSLKIISFDMNDEKFENETNLYNEKLNKINNDLTKAREIVH